MTKPWVALACALVMGCGSSGGGGGGGGADAGGGTGNGGGGGATGGSGGTGGGSPTISCDPFDNGNSCICTNGPNGTAGFDCSEASLGGAVLCCADSTYPESGTCSCAKSACTELTGLGTCSCGPAEADGTVSKCAGYATCCSVELNGAVIGCVCDQSGSSSTCDGIGSPTPSCAATVGTCGENRKPVTSCSQPGAL